MNLNDFDPEQHHIGVSFGTAQFLQAKGIEVREHEAFTWGRYVSVSRDEYARIASFCQGDDTIEEALVKAHL